MFSPNFENYIDIDYKMGNFVIRDATNEKVS